MQENWIGKSRGLQFRFRLVGTAPGGACDIEVFTTRPDTIFGASFVALRPATRSPRRSPPSDPEAAEFIADAAPAAPARPRSRPPRSAASTPAWRSSTRSIPTGGCRSTSPISC